MYKICSIITGLVWLGCANTQIYKETYGSDGKLLSVEASTTEGWRPWGKREAQNEMLIKQLQDNQWEMKVGSDVVSDQGEASDIINGLLEAFKLGMQIGAGVPVP